MRKSLFKTNENPKPTINNTILNRKIKDSDFFSPKISADKLALFGKKLIGRALEFDEKKVVSSTKIESSELKISNQKRVKRDLNLTFCPDFTSTPTHKIPKTSTPVLKKHVNLEPKIACPKKVSKRSSESSTRCKCYCNSTFKEGVDVSLVFFGNRLNRYTNQHVLVHDRLYRKVKTIKKMTYVTKTKQVYQKSRVLLNKKYSFLLNCANQVPKQNIFKFNAYDLYYTEENFQHFKLKLTNKNLKNKKLKRLVQISDKSKYDLL